MGLGLHITTSKAAGLVVTAVLATSVLALVPRETSPRAQAYFEKATNIIEARHINVADVDWDRIEREAKARNQGAQDTADTYPTVRWVLAELKEQHSALLAPSAASSTTNSYDRRADEKSPSGRLIGSNVGWIEVPPLSTIGPGGAERGKAYTEQLKNILLRLDGGAKCGWLIDLRGNSGGDMWPMLNGLDPLLGSAPFGFFTMRGDARQPWTRSELGIVPNIRPSARSRPAFSLVNASRHIAILLGPRTMSSGEMVAIAFEGLGNSRTFGAPTAGYTTGNAVHMLADGALLVLTETRVADRKGLAVSGPVVPDEEAGQAEAPKKALAWLARRCVQTKASAL